MDSTDELRAVVAKEELHGMLENEHVKHASVPILIFANKMDAPGALSVVKCTSLLGLETIIDQPWHITCVRVNKQMSVSQIHVSLML